MLNILAITWEQMSALLERNLEVKIGSFDTVTTKWKGGSERTIVDLCLYHG